MEGPFGTPIYSTTTRTFSNLAENTACALFLSLLGCSMGAKERECIHGCPEGGENSGISVSA